MVSMHDLCYMAEPSNKKFFKCIHNLFSLHISLPKYFLPIRFATLYFAYTATTLYKFYKINKFYKIQN